MPFSVRCLTLTLNVCANGGKFVFDALVAAVEVMDVAKPGFALGSQTREDQGGRGPKVRRLHWRAAQLINTAFR